jgi:hypothetical protein
MILRWSWATVTLGVVLGLCWGAEAEIYLWTDEGGIVHMTDQWSNVPESMRSRASVRDSSPTVSDTRPAPESSGTPETSAEPGPTKPLPRQMPSDTTEIPSPSPLVPPKTSYSSGDTSAPIPDYRRHGSRAKKPSPPFPYNLRLAPSDRNSVWVGPNRVPKDAFTYPHVALEKQAQFRDRLRTLEQRKSAPRKASPGQTGLPETRQLR